jgi:hypothetical protein
MTTTRLKLDAHTRGLLGGNHKGSLAGGINGSLLSAEKPSVGKATRYVDFLLFDFSQCRRG